ncbi:MAG TPA: hypothetical protein VMW94_09930 [Actinomycetes bacterium]|nr:hypothetical protein [Actinomycetes bacterium]
MNASGLVYAAIVVMWGAVLIPMWLRRHDASSEDRSAERFGQAMRVLSRRGSTDNRREIVVPRRREAPARPAPAVPSRTGRQIVSRPVTTPERPAVPAGDPAAPAPNPRPRPARSPRAEARAQLARRRARSLAVIGVVTALVALLAALSVVPVWAPVLPGLLLVSFVVHLRLQAKRAAERRRPQARPDAASGAAVGESTKSRRRDSGAAVAPSGEVGLAAPVDLATASEPSWQPNPLPLPTYVTAPKAVRPIRVIDLTAPGAWTSGRLLEDEVPVLEDTLADATADAETLDALLDNDVALDAERQAASEGGQPPSARAVGD